MHHTLLGGGELERQLLDQSRAQMIGFGIGGGPLFPLRLSLPQREAEFKQEKLFKNKALVKRRVSVIWEYSFLNMFPLPLAGGERDLANWK